MIDYQKWLDRINNLIRVQSDLSLEMVSTNFTQRDLIELRIIMESLIEIEFQQAERGEE